jgi:hypothetical protein
VPATAPCSTFLYVPLPGFGLFSAPGLLPSVADPGPSRALLQIVAGGRIEIFVRICACRPFLLKDRHVR